jgi:hypothetical protein
VSDEELLSYRVSIDESKLPLPGEEVISEEIQSKLNELEDRYGKGEIQLGDYMKQRDVLNRQISSENIVLYQTARDRARADLTWRAEQSAFFRARPEYEYSKDGSPKGKMLYGALNQTVVELDSNPENVGLSGMALLIKADKMVKEAFGLNQKPEEKLTEKKEEVKEKVITELKEIKPPTKAPDVKTLANIPAAQAPDVEGPWSALDKLSGAAYEEALERLTPIQRDKYLSAR